MKTLTTLIQIVFIVSILAIARNQHINLTNYQYPKLEDSETTEFITVPIIGTNDIHGNFFSKEIKFLGNKMTVGGLDNLSSIIKEIKNDWNNQVLLLDGGDQFQGGIENELSKGEVITDFINEVGYDALAIGNHEFDFEDEFLKENIERLKNTKYVSSNIKYESDNSSNNKFFNDNIKPYKIVELYENKIKIGIIGLTPLESTVTTSSKTFIKKFKFYEHIEAIKKYSKLLREEHKVNAVVLVSHLGIHCPIENELELSIKSNTQVQLKDLSCIYHNESLNELLLSMKDEDLDLIDAIVGGHFHYNNNLFHKHIPFISSKVGGSYFSMIYLRFNKYTFELNRNHSLIEGPFPNCEKVFLKSKICDLNDYSTIYKYGKLVQPMIHNKLFSRDQNLISKSINILREVQKLKRKIGVSTITMDRADNQLGNIVSFCIKDKINADIGLINAGVLRTTLLPGIITVEDIKNLLPFESNKLSYVSVKGKNIKAMIKLIIEENDNLIRINGLKVKYTKEGKNIIIEDVRLIDKTPIFDEKFYKIASTSFLLYEQKDGFIGIKHEDFYNIKDVINTSFTMFEVVSECIEKKIKFINEKMLNYKTYYFDKSINLSKQIKDDSFYFVNEKDWFKNKLNLNDY